MPWAYMFIIAMLGAFLFYGFDQMTKMSQDVKYIKMKLDKASN